MNIEERFWSKTETSTEHSYNGTPCIDWTAYRMPNGYGYINIDQNGGYAHRVSYQLDHGDIPSGMCVCHHCDRRCCVNPAHLFLGTHQDNIDDMKAKGRSGGAHQGALNHNARLNEHTVVLIKRFLHRHPPKPGLSGTSCSFLARWFDVGRNTISQINSGKRWPHVKVEGVSS